MSLINKMLQDLELRSAGNVTGGGMPRQVRAVPEHAGMHRAWWLVMLLALLLAGACVWFWLRPAAQAVATPLGLRLAADLSVLPSPAAQAPLPPDHGAPVPVPVPAPAATAIAVVGPIAPVAPVAEDSHHLDAPRIDARHSDPRHIDTAADKPKPVSAATKPALASIPKSAAPALKTGDPTGSAAGSGTDAASTAKLAKQVKELTAQQRAENDYRKAGSALQQGRQAEAIDGLEQAVQLDAQHAAARQMLVGLLLQAKRTDEAVHMAQEGLALDPAQVGLAMILARVQVEQGNLRPALDTLSHSLPYAQERADYQAFLAALLQRDKRHKDAIEHYLTALGKAPQNGLWWMGLGISLQAENRLPEAREAFGRAKTANTLSPELQAFVDQKLAQLAH